MSVTVIGCGYTGQRLAARARRRGRDVIALVRSSASRQTLDALGVAAYRLDLDEEVEGGLPASFTSDRQLIYMVPPDTDGVTDDRMTRFLAAITGRPRCLVYLSTTGVYGDTGGASVDEETPPNPGSDRARRRLDAEGQAIRWAHAADVAVRILRVPGIYGPGRLPLDRLSRGGPVLAPDPGRPGNRIHVDDLVRVSLAACDYDGPLEIFNVGDGDPTDAGSFNELLAREAGLAPPATRSLEEMLERASPMGREFLSESRRVDVSRMRAALGFEPRYPDPLSGIRASLDELAGDRPV